MKILIAMKAKELISVSAEQSLLQQEYRKMFTEECERLGVQSPFELSDDGMRDFFADISANWKKRKLELYKDGQIESNQV